MFFIIDFGQSQKQNNNIIIPDTRFLNADTVTELYFNHLYSFSTRILKKIIPQKWVDWMNKNYHSLYEFFRIVFSKK